MIPIDRSGTLRLYVMTFAVGAACMGCQQAETPATSVSSVPIEAKDPLNVPPPLSDTMQETELGLFRKASQVTVGSDPEAAFKLFRNAQSGFESEALPPHFTAPYKARTWEGADESFGVITFDGKVVEAMDQITANQQDVDTVVAQYSERLRGLGELKNIAGKSVSYWFWDTTGQRLMICAVKQPNGTVMLTQAVGIDSAMDALRMNEIRAREDQSEADQLIGKREAVG